MPSDSTPRPTDFWRYVECFAHLMQRIEIGPGCWRWTRKCNRFGYGVISMGLERPQYAHRVVYELLVGPIPPGMSLLHSCDNPSCVNPAHLRPGTAKENTADMVQRGRWRKPPASGPRKLTAEQVAAIRTAYVSKHGTLRALAAEYHVTPQYLSKVVRGLFRVTC